MNFYSIAPFIRQHYPQYYSIESYPAVRSVCIRKVAEEWAVLGNFARTPLVVGDVTFKNSEQLFQLMKFKEEEPILAVYNAKTPKMIAKHWEKTHRREDWGRMIVDAMKFCITQKYEQSEDFRKELERSKGKYIVEDQTSFPKKTPDTWGVKQQGNDFIGPNLLGRLLMELRDKGKLDYQLPDDALYFFNYLNY
jgi:ribA/ribD-fused uncharacterized protein